MSCTSFLMISLLSDSKSISLDTPSEQNKIKTKLLSIEDLINNSEEKKHFKQLQTIIVFNNCISLNRRWALIKSFG